MMVPQKLSMVAMAAKASAVIAAGNTMATAVAMVAVLAVAATRTKTLAATALGGVTDNNQPKAVEEEMAAETAMAKGQQQ
jgi:hypothetical protein